MRDLLTWYLPLYFLLFFGVAFAWRTWRVAKITGINPYKLAVNPGPEQITNRYFRLMPLLSLVAAAAYLAGPGAYAYLAPLAWLEHGALQWIGLGMMTVALLLIVVAQGQMGKSWRIGVDRETRTEFVRSGLFKYSRNPIFLGIVLSVSGFFLLLPNALTLLVMMLDLSLIQVQIRIEEEFLARAHGASYSQYCNEVRRWI